MPFHNNVWIPIIIFLGFCILSILCIKCGFIKFRRIFLEFKSRSSILNIFAIIFGVSLHTLPRKNFARLLLMTFILFSFVYRNIYQGGLFLHMQSEIRKGPVTSINEMVEKGFDFYISTAAVVHAKNIKILQRFVFNEQYEICVF